MHFSFAQTAPAQYYDFIKKADSLYIIKDYKASAAAYSAAFKSFAWKGFANDRYSAARSWAMAGMPDSAFYNLERIAKKGAYADYDKITKDSDLVSLHSDQRWNMILKFINGNKNNTSLYIELENMVIEDQKWRHLMTESKNSAKDSIPHDTINQHMILTDSLNYYKLRDIFAKYGYPNKDLVGDKGSGNFWLLVQHQDRRPAFQDSVLKAMKVEVDRDKASPSNYAYLVDRVCINSNKEQVYGTQMQLNHDSTSYEPRPVIEPSKLDERRKSMHLSGIEVYISEMNKNYSGYLKKK